MRRRDVIAGVSGAALAWPGAPNAQQSAGPRVGFLMAADPEPAWSQFRKAMADLGYVEGRNVKFEPRASTAGVRLNEAAASLIDADVDVIVAVLTPAIMAARQATAKIPIIFNGGAPDAGLVTNMARPEGNMTGVYGAVAMTIGKSLQVLREIKPSTKAIAVLLNTPDPFNVVLHRELEAAGRLQQIEIVPASIKGREDLVPAFEMIAKHGVGGVVVQPSVPLEEAARLAIRHRIPAMSFRREFAEAGGLLSYGADQPELYRVVASYVDRVLKGTPTALLPVQMGTRFELIVNQKTAKAMGLTFSAMFLGRADEVIE